MEENPVRGDEQMPYAEGSIPYYEYSSVRQPAQPFIPPPLPPKRSRNRGLILILAVGSVFLVVVLVFLSGLPQALFHQSTITLTPVAALPTHAPTSLATPTTNFRPASCPFPLGSGMVDGQTVKCGYVTVPETRSNPSGATAQLAVAIFKSPHVQNDPYPVIRLEGGPGGPSLDNWARFITSTNFSTFVFNHDLIMFDQRGTGYSTPSLACPETLQLQFDTLNEHLSATDSERLLLHALGVCHDRLVRSGVDLNAFNSIENAADVHDLILALGYKQANLYGVSYGTRLALTTMRLYPSVIRSVVLDSTYPPQKNRTDLPSVAQRVFNVLFQGCAADTNCATLYPHLDTVFYQLITDLNATPVHFQTTDITTGKSYHVVMAGNDFVFVLFSALYVTQFIPDLPRMVFQVRDHNYTLLSKMYGAVEFDDNFSDGMFYSDECSEDWNFLTQNDIAAAMQGIAPQIRPALQTDLQQEYDACRLWHVQQAPAAQKQPVVSAIPTLILSDEYDPITPPANGKLAAQTLKNSYYFLFPGLGHGAEYNSPCVDSIISAFDDNPTQKPSDACIVNMGEPNFV
ncbi:MAG TPA: alpha/beta fold hydrolase [Ktedonobacteraceae bacterium]